jgi:pimeloyl-ACP methyl ester carboxylesterase
VPGEFVVVDGRAFEYEDIPGETPPLVFLHEGLGSVELWRGFHREVAAATGHRAVAYSRLGHGASDPPATPRTIRFMHDEARDVLPRLLDALQVQAPLMVGHSDGASIALIHAAEHPVAGLVLMAPHVYVEELTLASIRAAKVAYEEQGLRERMARRHRDPDACFYGWNAVWLDPQFAEWNLEDVLPKVRCPALLIQGEDDQYGSVAQIDRIADSVAGPVERLVLPDCRHSPHLDQPEATRAAVAGFVHAVATRKRPS